MIDKVFSFFSITIVACFYPYTFYNYSILPNVIPVHFNIKGEIDQYGSKLFILLFPIILTTVLILFKYYLVMINTVLIIYILIMK